MTTFQRCDIEHQLTRICTFVVLTAPLPTFGFTHNRKGVRKNLVRGRATSSEEIVSPHLLICTNWFELKLCVKCNYYSSIVLISSVYAVATVVRIIVHCSSAQSCLFEP